MITDDLHLRSAWHVCLLTNIRMWPTLYYIQWLQLVTTIGEKLQTTVKGAFIIYANVDFKNEFHLFKMRQDLTSILLPFNIQHALNFNEIWAFTAATQSWNIKIKMTFSILVVKLTAFEVSKGNINIYMLAERLFNWWSEKLYKLIRRAHFVIEDVIARSS